MAKVIMRRSARLAGKGKTSVIVQMDLKTKSQSKTVNTKRVVSPSRTTRAERLRKRNEHKEHKQTKGGREKEELKEKEEEENKLLYYDWLKDK